jgi:CheY-like chemotaxis protein
MATDERTLTMFAQPKVLLVEDNPAFRSLVALRLQLLGCSCLAVGSVPEAIDALEREHFDRVVSDHSLPGPSGLDLLAYVSRRTPDTDVVLMCSDVDGELRSHAYAGGATAVHRKDELLDRFAALVPVTRELALAA